MARWAHGMSDGVLGLFLSGVLSLGPGSSVASVSPPPPRWRPYRVSEPATAPVQTASGHTYLVHAPSERGTGLFAVAGVLGATALVEHALAVGLINRTCGVLGDEVAMVETEDTTDEERAEQVAGLAGLGVACGAAVSPALMLRLSTPLLLGGALGLASWGASKRARADAFRDRFIFDRERRAKPIVYDAVGGTLLATGLSLWIGTRITLLDNRTGCDGIRCYAWYDFSTLHTSAAMSIAGAAVLTYGRVYARQRRRYREIESLHIAPTLSRESFGVTLGRRF